MWATKFIIEGQEFTAKFEKFEDMLSSESVMDEIGIVNYSYQKFGGD